jgi:EAL domain-containing protein (putative c-di-GMP-specific phosphodiesterase class I)
VPGIEPEELARDLLAALHEPFHLEDEQPITMRASVGVVEVNADLAEADALLRAADLALHAAKEDGRDRVVCHDPGRTSRQLTRFGIALALPNAVAQGELGLRYQSMVRLRDGGLHGREALLRWRHPTFGELPPAEFVRIAEESRAILSIGRWVLEQACRTLCETTWPSINVNVSPRQLYSPTFVPDVRHCLDSTGVAANRLRFEVTESVVMNSHDPEPLQALRAVAELGVTIALDDFGTGYSNLAALRRLPLSELKLAGTLLETLDGSHHGPPADPRIVATVVDLAHQLGLTVTAEGVETPAQDQLVRSIGCDVGQGWLYDLTHPVHYQPVLAGPGDGVQITL